MRTKRDDQRCEPARQAAQAGVGGDMPEGAFAEAPAITWDHLDGPLMCWAGQIHWLTLPERFRLWFGLTTVEAIAAKRFTGFLAKPATPEVRS